MDTITWAITAVSLFGVIANIYKKPICYVLWTMTNAYWCGHNYMHSELQQAVLFAVYFVLSLWGLYTWGRHRRPDNRIEVPKKIRRKAYK